MITTDSSVGRNSTVRYAAAPRTPRSDSSAASSSATGFCTSVWMPKNSRLLTIALRNAPNQCSSNSSLWKLPRPTKLTWPTSSVPYRPRRSVASSGHALNAV